MSCPICGEYFDDFDREPEYCKDLDTTVCEQCLKSVEEKHKITGKFVVHKCNECKNITKVEFIKYKKRGRSLGSKNTPKATRRNKDPGSVVKMNKCENCARLSTPKGKQCYTLSRILKEQVRDKGLPFFPNIVIPILEKTGRTCRRYKDVAHTAESTGCVKGLKEKG